MLVTNKFKKTVLVTLLLAFAASFSSAALASQVKTELLKAADTKISGAYVRTRFLKMMKKPFDSKSKKKALIIGDSHAQDFLNSVLENNYLKDYQISTRYIPAHCQIYQGQNASRHIQKKDTALCKKSDNLIQAKAQIAEADLIILVANWKEWAAKELPQTIQNMGLSPDQKLFVIGRKSFGKIAVRKYLRLPENELTSLRNKVDKEQDKVNGIMRKNLSKDIFIDLQQLVCGSPSTCPVFTSDLKLISFDGGHLTKDGARHVGKVLFQGSRLGGL